MAEFLQRNHFLGSKTMSKGFSEPKCTKTGKQWSEIKSFGLTHQSLKSFVQIGGSICGEVFVKELQTPAKH